MSYHQIIFFSLLSIRNVFRSPGQKTKIPKVVKPPKDVAYLSLNPAPAPDSVRLPIGELPLYKNRHLYSSYRLPASGLRTQSTAHLRSVGSTFSKNAFALEKDTFYPDQEPHVSKNTFVQNPGPLPEVQALASAPAKPTVTKVVAVTKPQRPVAEHLPKSSSFPSSIEPQRSERYVSALAKHYFDVLNTRAIYSGWLEPPRPKRKKSKKN